MVWYRFWYKLSHWLFQWRQDVDGDIAFVIMGAIAFVKYKEHTMTYFFWSDSFPKEIAGKWQGKDLQQ